MFFSVSHLRKGLFSLMCLLPGVLLAEQLCTYQTYNWNVERREATAVQTVQHAYSELSAEEIDPITGCTVCQEDQVEMRLPGLEPFKVCRYLEPKLRPVLLDLLERQEPVYKVIGYRVGKTRGKVDGQGNRTGFSNHSYGVAIDINPEQNGLYDNCIEYGPACRLIKGGAWHPEKPGSWTEGSTVVQAMESLGLKWGGKIAGRQKDFMHFSLTGY